MNKKQSIITALLTGTPIGCLGGLIGLGGAEFRLPVLVGLFKYSARKSVALNLAVSLITVLSSLFFRIPNINTDSLLPLWTTILFMIGGSMTGAYIGAHFSSRITEASLKRVIFFLLVFIGILLIVEGFYPLVPSGIQAYSLLLASFLAVLFGLGIGFVSSLLGVAGGELIIPTLILVFGVDIKIAGTTSLLISLPTIIIGIIKHASNGVSYGRQDITHLILPMGIGSILGAFLGTFLVSYIPSNIIKILLGIILMISALKLFLKKQQKS